MNLNHCFGRSLSGFRKLRSVQGIFFGTGAWEGEYVVASKAWGPLDLTLGMGWGRLGSRAPFNNPLRLISDRFEERPLGLKQAVGLGGKIGVTVFFEG